MTPSSASVSRTNAASAPRRPLPSVVGGRKWYCRADGAAVSLSTEPGVLKGLTRDITAPPCLLPTGQSPAAPSCARGMDRASGPVLSGCRGLEQLDPEPP